MVLNFKNFLGRSAPVMVVPPYTLYFSHSTLKNAPPPHPPTPHSISTGKYISVDNICDILIVKIFISDGIKNTVDGIIFACRLSRNNLCHLHA